jgi:transcriptional regulator with GAF, ATPase, and Fis domain
MTFVIPPLRERREDIALLLKAFLTKRGLSGRHDKLPPELERQFVNYDWPGNVRELDNKVRRLEVMKHLVAEGDIAELARSIFTVTEQPSLDTAATLFERVEEFERGLLLEALKAAHGNKCEAARLLGVHEATVRTKLKRYGISYDSSMVA